MPKPMPVLRNKAGEDKKAGERKVNEKELDQTISELIVE